MLFPASVPLLPIPRSLPSIAHKALICMTAKGPHEGGDARRIGGMGVWALSVCTLQQEIAGKMTGALTQDGAPRCLWAACPPAPSLSPFVLPKMMSHWLYTCSMLTGQRERSFCSAGKNWMILWDFFFLATCVFHVFIDGKNTKVFYIALISGIESLKQYWPTKPIYITCSGTQGI